MLLGGPLVYLLLGENYLPILEILVPITVVQAIRVAKSGSATVALSKERSGNAAVSNSFRVVSLPLSWLALIQTGSLMAVIYIAMIAEFMGYLMALRLAAQRAGLQLAPVLLPSGMVFMTLSAALISNWWYRPQPNLIDHLSHWSVWPVVGCGLLTLGLMSHLRGYILRRLRKRGEG
jgi:hypothetical protein